MARPSHDPASFPPTPPSTSRYLQDPRPQPTPAAPPLPPGPPGAAGSNRRRGMIAVALILAVLAAFCIGLFAGHDSGPGVADRSRPYGPYLPGMGPIVIVDVDNYYSYLNLSVRPTLLTVSVSFTGAACDAVGHDDKGVVARLLEAKDAARHALEDNLRITPPPQFQHLHETVRDVFDHTAKTADELVGCIEGKNTGCPQAQSDLVQLLDDAGRLTGDVKQLVKAL